MVVSESSINNIMGGLESTGGVTLHNHRRKLKQRFEIIAKLGQGTYGKVQLGINKETGQEVAIKTIKKCKIETEADLIRIRREIQIMSSLRHPYIIHIYEVFENRDKMVLVMEYAAGGELYDYLSKKKVLNEQEARRIFRQIAMAVYYCHKHQICHRDLKLENILLDEQGNAKIADFGLSNVFDKNRLLNTFCGSPLYASPEIVKGIPYYGPEVDCWSLGVLLYTLVYGAMPFDGSNFKRLVRQISAGEYFEPKNPSTASEVIAGLLTVKGSERLDITGVCQHPWMDEEGKVSCYRLAIELAEQEPNRLDLLLALAPKENQMPSVPPEIPSQPQLSEKPARSMSLSALPTVQPSFTAPLPSPSPPSQSKAERKEREEHSEKEKKRERSSSRTRKKEVEEEKPKRKSVKTKKKSDPELTKEEMEKVLEEAKKLSEMIAQAPVVEPSSTGAPKLRDTNVTEQPKSEQPSVVPKQPKTDEPTTEIKEKPKEVKKIKKNKQEKKEEDPKEPTPGSRPSLKKEKEVDIPDRNLAANAKPVEEEPAKFMEVAKEPETSSIMNDLKEPTDTKESTPPVRKDSIRRKSKVFETAEIFNRSASMEKTPQKKVFLPGVKVSDAKAAFERRSSISQDTNPDFCLASTINVNKLIENELNKDSGDAERLKKENAVKVISHAISESSMNKASTLPRRKLSKPSMIPRAEPENMVANSSISQVVYPAPIPPPRPSLAKQESGPIEHIIPIKIEQRDDKAPVSKQGSLSSRTSSISSIGRQDSDSSTTTIGTPSLSASCEPIRKSPREVIIPIAVEGAGYVTPSASTLSKISSFSEGEDEEHSGPMRGFRLHNTRRRVEATDSLSSDEDDDNFEMLTAENLFSSLLSRVRNLTYRLNENESRPSFPRLFNQSVFDSPRRRLMETKSFTEQDPVPWRRKRETTSSSTLPRGFTTRPLRRTLTGGDENRKPGRPPPASSSASTSRRRSEDEVVEDFLATGKLSSLDRVRSYLEGLRRTSIETTPPLRRYFSSDSPRTNYPPIPRNRFSSIDAGCNSYSYINGDRCLFDEPKLPCVQRDPSCSKTNGGNGFSKFSDYNGFTGNKLAYPRRELHAEGKLLKGMDSFHQISNSTNKKLHGGSKLPDDIDFNVLPKEENCSRVEKPEHKKSKGIQVENDFCSREQQNIKNIANFYDDSSFIDMDLKNFEVGTAPSQNHKDKSLDKRSEKMDIDLKRTEPEVTNVTKTKFKSNKVKENIENNVQSNETIKITDKGSRIPKVIEKASIASNLGDPTVKSSKTIFKTDEKAKVNSKISNKLPFKSATGESVPGISGQVHTIVQNAAGSQPNSEKSYKDFNLQNKTEENEFTFPEDKQNLGKSINEFKVTDNIKTSKKNNESRVNKAIKALRKKSESFENHFSESKLLKRAVSLEDVRSDKTSRCKRASSLKPEGTFEKKEGPKAKKGGAFDSLYKNNQDREARIANLKRLDLVKGGGELSADSTPTGDPDEQESMLSATDNSDTWSSCDLGERLLDPSTDECVLERIRRKSFYHRFNMPKKHTYNRSLSNMERKRYY